MARHRSPAPAGRPPRPRRASIQQPINARTVRGTWLLVALPLLLVAFTVGRPQPLPRPALPPTFDGAAAADLARDLADKYPDRAPGSVGALGAAQWFRDQLQTYGFTGRTDTFTATLPGRGKVELHNVVAVAQGASARTIVVMSHRDNDGTGPGAVDNASGTAALIELARAYAPLSGPGGARVQPAHRLVFVSTDGGSYGALGAARFAEQSPFAADAVAVLSLDSLGGQDVPRLVLAADRPRSPASELVRTSVARIAEESGREPRYAGWAQQLLELAFPFTLNEQGVFVARGTPSITISTAPEVPQPLFRDTTVDEERLGELGRAVQGLLGSLDGGLELDETTTSYVFLGRRIIKGWAIQLALITALLPFLVGAIDLFARCRRRHIRLVGAVRSLRRRLAYWLYAAVLVLGAARYGLFPDAEPGRPVPLTVTDSVEPSTLGLAVIATLLLAGWLVSRERLIPRRPATVDEKLAGYSVALLALGLLALVVVATNPYSLIFLLPSLYAWLWLPQAYAAPAVARVVLLLLGLAGPVLLVVSFARRFELGFDAPWYLLSLVGSGYSSLLAALLAFVWAAIAAQLAALAVGRYAAYPEPGSLPQRQPLRALLHRAPARKRVEAVEEMEA
jgi:Peptidase family M28